MTFSEQIVYGLTKPSKYKELLELKKRRFVAYVLVLMLVMGIVGYVIPTAAVITGFGGFEKLFSERMGALEYNGDELNIEKTFKMNCLGTNILINTDYETIPDEKLTNEQGIYVAIGSKTIRMAVPTVEGWVDYMTMEMNQVLAPGFNNESLVDMIPYLYVGFGFSFLFTCLGYFLKYGLFAVILALCVNSMNKHIGAGYTYGQVFMICFYGESLGMLISNFNLAMGLLPGMLVSMVTVFVSIHFITTAITIANKNNQV